MDTINPQKIKLLKLYEILRQHIDEDRPLSTNQLCAMLETEGISCDRRTLAEDIDILNANGLKNSRPTHAVFPSFYVMISIGSESPDTVTFMLLKCTSA